MLTYPQAKRRVVPHAGVLLARLLGILAASEVSPAALAHEDEVDIGRSAAGQIVPVIEFEPPLTLSHSPFPGISGYATGAVGFHSVLFDVPTNDLFQISPSADLRFILVAKDPGIEVWNDHGSAFMNVGESFYIGPAPFDTHPVWNITTGTPGNTYSITLKLHDLNGVYTESEEFILSFTPIAPAQLSIQDNGDDTVTVNFVGSPEGEYVVQAATTLAGEGDWASVSTNTAEHDGTWNYTESKNSHVQRYFRSISR